MVTCDEYAFNAFLEKADQQDGHTLLKSDHVFPVNENGKVIVILYSQLSTDSFITWHKKLKSLANDGKIVYVLRHYVQNKSEQKTRLSGYGVELAIKSTEYKAKDDSKVETDESKEASENEVDEVDGFIFSTLKKLYPDDEEKLSNFRKHLIDSNKELAPLKVWQLQDLSIQAGQKVANASTEEALDLLKDISQNFPSLAKSLASTTVTKEFLKEMKENQQIIENELRMSAGESALFINGLQADLDIYDVFTLLDTLKGEANVIEGLNGMGFKVIYNL